MNSSSNHKSPRDEASCASWGLIIGAGLGLLATIVFGKWLSNVLILGCVGYTIGALIDRHRS